MNKAQYQEYLKSGHWTKTRRAALERADYACQLCNSDSEVNVHHRTYERVKHERPADLIVLCRDCHAKFHDKLANIESSESELWDDEPPEWHKQVLRWAVEEKLGRWVELAWYELMLKMGLSAPDAIECVSNDLNGGGYHRRIRKDMRQ
jgi:hypothetical protein